MIETAIAPLFVPADKPALLAKARASAADAIILDLEDAVSPNQKSAARGLFSESLGGPVTVRINAVNTEWHQPDLAVMANPDVAAIMLSKAEDPAVIEAVRRAASRPMQVVALVETALGMENVNSIAKAADRLAFGSLDYAADLGAVPDHDVLAYARSRIVLASRLANRPPPLDGVTPDFRNAEACQMDTAHAIRMGFGGRLCIHPSQIAIVRGAYVPSEAEVEWARRIAALGSGAVSLDGKMVDAPVKARAAQVLERWNRLKD